MASATAGPQPASPGPAPEQEAPDRSFPQEPRVGIGAVVLRWAPPPATGKEVLLVRRAKPPKLGCWSFPGGSLELGEPIVDGAVREVAEETGITLANAAAAPDELYGRDTNTLDSPVPFAAADVMARDPEDRLQFHYAIIEVAARPADPQQVPQPTSDVSAARWFPVDDLPALPDLTVNCASIAKEADLRFDLL